MRKANRWTLLSIGILTILLFSCKDFSSFELPHSIKVKTEDAEYPVPIGSLTVDFDDYINAEKLQQKMGTVNTKDTPLDIPFEATPEEVQAKIDEQRTFFVYDYYPGKDASTQEYIINYPVATVPLDMNQYMKTGLNIDSKVNDQLKQEIKVPDTKDVSSESGQPPTVTLPNINSLLVDKFEVSGKNPLTLGAVETPGMYYSSLDLAHLPTGSNFSPKSPEDFEQIKIENLPLEITMPTFKTMTFSEGALELEVSRADGPSVIVADDFLYQIQIFLIDAETGKSISGSDVKDISSYPQTFSISLSEKTITPNMELKIEYVYGGGRAEVYHTYRIKPKLSSGTKISTITGLTMSADELGSKRDIEIPVDMSKLSAYLLYGTIRKGSLSFSAPMPPLWKNVESTAKIQLTGAIKVFHEKFHDAGNKGEYILNKEISSLEGEKIDFSEGATGVNIIGTVSLAFNDSTITFSNTANETQVKVTCHFDITELEKVRVNMSALIQKDSITKQIPVSFGDVSDYIMGVEFTSFLLQGDIDTDFPAKELNVTIGLKAEKLHIPQTTDTRNIVAEKEEDKTFNLQADADPVQEVSFIDEKNKKNTEFPFDVSIAFAGEDEAHPSYIDLYRLTLGKSYHLTPHLSFKFDWNFIRINTANMDDDKIEAKEQPLGLSFSDLLESYTSDNPQYNDIIEHIKFTGIDGYVYLTRPAVKTGKEDPLTKLGTFNGAIKLVYKGDDTGVDLIDSTEPLELKTGKTFAELADKNRTIISKEKFMPENYSAKVTNYKDTNESVLCWALNERLDDIKFRYKVGLSGGTEGGMKFTKEDLESLGMDIATGGSESNADGIVSIQISIAICLPFKLNIDDNIQITDLLDFIGNSVELEMPDSKDYEEYLDLAKEVRCSYTISNTTGMNITAQFADKAALISPKQLILNSGENVFYLSQEEIKSVATSKEKFSPIINTLIHEGSVNIPRHAKLSCSVVLWVTTGGEWSKTW